MKSLSAVHYHFQMHDVEHVHHTNYDEKNKCFKHAVYENKENGIAITIPIQEKELEDEFVAAACGWLRIPNLEEKNIN